MRMRKKYHFAPWECKFPKEDWNVCKPGKKPKTDDEYLEILSLIIFQAGFNWRVVREKWKDLKKPFRNFKIEDVARLTSKQQQALLKNPKMIKNKRKIEAIVTNAKIFLEITKNFGSFENYLKTLRTLRENEKIKKIKNRLVGIGDYSAEFFLHSVGDI